MITPGHESSLVTVPGKERPTEHLTRGIVGGRKGGETRVGEREERGEEKVG